MTATAEADRAVAMRNLKFMIRSRQMGLVDVSLGWDSPSAIYAALLFVILGVGRLTRFVRRQNSRRCVLPSERQRVGYRDGGQHEEDGIWVA